MTDAGLTAAMVSDAPAAARKRVVVAGRLLLAVLLVLGWELGARTLGSVFFAAPLDVAARIVTLARSGQLAADVASTLRVSALGFAIACVAGVLLPFLLRRSPRVSAAVEPYIMASMGIPKYALAPWLILWFGIGDLPKLVVVTLMVFYIIFITTSAGIRAVDQRLIAMARVAGAGETRDRARDHLEIAIAVLLHRPESGVAARGQCHHRRRIPGRDRGRRSLHRAFPTSRGHGWRFCRHRDCDGAGSGDHGRGE